MPCASAPCVVIDPCAVTMMGPPGPVSMVPASARTPIALTPLVVIGPEEVTLMLPPSEAAAMPMPFPPCVVMPGPV